MSPHRALLPSSMLTLPPRLVLAQIYYWRCPCPHQQDTPWEDCTQGTLLVTSHQLDAAPFPATLWTWPSCQFLSQPRVLLPKPWADGFSVIVESKFCLSPERLHAQPGPLRCVRKDLPFLNPCWLLLILHLFTLGLVIPLMMISSRTLLGHEVRLTVAVPCILPVALFGHGCHIGTSSHVGPPWLAKTDNKESCLASSSTSSFSTIGGGPASPVTCQCHSGSARH